MHSLDTEGDVSKFLFYREVECHRQAQTNLKLLNRLGVRLKTLEGIFLDKSDLSMFDYKENENAATLTVEVVNEIHTSLHSKYAKELGVSRDNIEKLFHFNKAFDLFEDEYRSEAKTKDSVQFLKDLDVDPSVLLDTNLYTVHELFQSQANRSSEIIAYFKNDSLN
ncbi:MAG: hypothetical protein KA715_12460 [Xanthomonadaceae bacterium]|nr:hypothetical protein [Xanthomonadaceae bacterium]